MQIGGAILAVILAGVYGFDYIKVAVYINIIGFLSVVTIVLALLWQELREESRLHPLSAGRLIGWIVLGLFMAWGSQVVATIIETGILGISPESQNTDMIVDISRSNPMFILVPALVGPILEELIFRKIIFRVFYKRWNFFVSALLSSLIFSAAHFEFIHILLYAAMGFVFAYLYVKTKRIIVPILVHMLLNTIAVVGSLAIDVDKLEEIQNQTQMIWTFFGG